MAEWKDEVRLDDVTCDGETDRALRVIIEGDTHWVPKSQVSDNSEVYKEGDEGTLVLNPWFAEKEGLG